MSPLSLDYAAKNAVGKTYPWAPHWMLEEAVNGMRCHLHAYHPGEWVLREVSKWASMEKPLIKSDYVCIYPAEPSSSNRICDDVR